MENTLLKSLCCPKCKADIKKEQTNWYCFNCNFKYKDENDIPILVNLENLPRHLQGQIRYFNKESKSLVKYELSEWQKNYIGRFCKTFPLIKEKLIIDCGVGSGYMTIELAKLGANVIATDLTLQNLINLKKTAKELGLENKIMPVCCDAQSLSIKKGIADYFVSNAVLEHLPEDQKAVEEIERVCKDSAGCLITVPLKFKFVNPLFWAPLYIADRNIGHLRRYDEKKLKERFKNWRLSKTLYTGHFKKGVKIIINMIVKIFDENQIELEDKQKENKRWGASNIICFFKK